MKPNHETLVGNAACMVDEAAGALLGRECARRGGGGFGEDGGAGVARGTRLRGQQTVKQQSAMGRVGFS